jgi:hypothetical protein
MKALIALTLALSGAVVATAAPEPGLPAVFTQEGQADLPQVEQAGRVAYLNGGAGLDEAGYMKSRAKEFPLQFVFSGRGGEYGVADRVTVRRGSEEMVSVPDAGPYLMVQLPPGRYTVEATFNGVVEHRSVTVGNGTSRVNWNTPKASNPNTTN